jgi:DNA-binding beta-propeller fold protein YncE
MATNSFLTRAAISGVLLLTAAAAFAQAPLIASRPIAVPGGPGGFDWMLVDQAKHRLYAAHGGTKTLTVLDLNTQKLQQIPAGEVSGAVVDAADGKVFVACGDNKVVVLDNDTLRKTAEIAVPGPVDDIKLDPKRGMVYADHDDGANVWVINAQTNTLAGSIAVAGAPEAMVYDAGADRLYQNIKPADAVDVIDPATDKILAIWKTAPARAPHGLVLDTLTHRLFSAGGNGMLVALDQKTGRVTASVAIAPGTDQIGFDPKRRRIYCASRGFIAVVHETADGMRLLDNVPSPKGAHTLAVDAATGNVWICYSNPSGSYLEKFTAAK